MTSGDGNTPAVMPARSLQFDRYVLDLDRGCLTLNGTEVVLRPKTFAVLQFLVENDGRLVSKDELMAAVWPDVTVTDDALVQSIGELRRALGDDGQRLIKTVPRRGYRFEAAVSADVPAEPVVTHRAPNSATSPDGSQVSAPRAMPVITPADPPLTGGTPAPAASHQGARPWVSNIQDDASRLLAMALGVWRGGPTGRRRGLLVGVVVIVLLAAVMMARLGSERTAPRTPGASVPESKTAKVDAKPVIAVLPFVNQSDDPTRAYFADGLTQDVISALGRFSALTVMSWNAVAPFKGKPTSPQDIARSLGVRYQVEGSIHRTGERVRVTAQLVDTSGRVLWSARFDEALSDLFALQDKITTQIAGALAIRVTQAEQRRVLSKPTESLEAYDYVLRARPALQRPARESIVEARALLRRAVQLDPGYAEAYAALAETYHIDISWGWAQSPAAVLGRAEEMARAALQRNDFEQSAHIVLGRIHLFHNRYEQAAAAMDRAIAINPSDARGLAGRGNILMWLGQTDAAIATLELAQRIDPALNAVDRFSLSMAYYLNRRYDEAIEQAELNLRNSESSHFSQVVLAAALAQQNRTDAAARVVTTIRRIYPAFDPQTFGNKFRNPTSLEDLRVGMRKAGLISADTAAPPAGK